QVIHFTRKRYVNKHVYFLNGVPLASTDSIRDLGVVFFSNLSWELHIQTLVNRAYRKLGFVMRSYKYFHNISTLRLLFCALVRPHLEYAVTVWAPYQTKYCVMIESIQHRFLRRV
ncbi:Putative uncharacterized transposon-derived protein ZK1236.4, partial [Camponotus floridanus]